MIVVQPEERPGWALAALALANTALLIFLRVGPVASPFGFVGIPFLLGHFTLSGVLAGVAARGLLRFLPRAPAVGVAACAGVVVGVLAALSWDRPSDEPLLPRALAWVALAAVAWAITARRRQRGPATVAAAGLCVLWLVGARLDS